MKFYPGPDIWFYVEHPKGWDCYDKYEPSHSWKIPRKTIAKNMLYWRDIEGPKMTAVERKDLYMKNFPKTRIRPQACLGMVYATGQRFIRLARAPPLGFKCAPLPVNLAAARVIKVELAKKRKLAAKQKKKAKAAAKKAKKEAKLAKQKAAAKKALTKQN